MKRKLLIIVMGILFSFHIGLAKIIKIKGKVIRIDKNQGIVIVKSEDNKKYGFAVSKEMLKGVSKGITVVVVLDSNKEKVLKIERVIPPGPK